MTQRVLLSLTVSRKLFFFRVLFLGERFELLFLDSETLV